MVDNLMCPMITVFCVCTVQTRSHFCLILPLFLSDLFVLCFKAQPTSVVFKLGSGDQQGVLEYVVGDPHQKEELNIFTLIILEAETTREK